MPELEVSYGAGPSRVVRLDGHLVAIGSAADSADLVLADPTVSGTHALLERVGATWLLRDVGSRNGSRVNGERLSGQRRLLDGDELLVGRTRLIFRDRAATGRRRTDGLVPPPSNLTRMERRTLVELCRPLLAHNVFQPPASVREIAERLFVGKNAVQAHLANLYDKFAIHEELDRRVALANEAMRRGAVTMADLEDPLAGDRG
jgi:hypothetical protein